MTTSKSSSSLPPAARIGRASAWRPAAPPASSGRARRLGVEVDGLCFRSWRARSAGRSRRLGVRLGRKHLAHAMNSVFLAVTVTSGARGTTGPSQLNITFNLKDQRWTAATGAERTY
jgi:hypothetical protein